MLIKEVRYTTVHESYTEYYKNGTTLHYTNIYHTSDSTLHYTTLSLNFSELSVKVRKLRQQNLRQKVEKFWNQESEFKLILFLVFKFLSCIFSLPFHAFVKQMVNTIQYNTLHYTPLHRTLK